MFSPFPGDGLNLSEEEYPRMRLSCGQTDFVFPPSSRSTAIDPDSGFGQVELMGVKKEDVGAAVKSGELEPGNVVMVRGQQYKVVGVTGGGMPCELYGGADLFVFDKPFPMNAKKVLAYHCPPPSYNQSKAWVPTKCCTGKFSPSSFEIFIFWGFQEVWHGMCRRQFFNSGI